MRLAKGNTRTPISTVILTNGNYSDLEDADIDTVEFGLFSEPVIANTRVYKVPFTTVGVSIQPEQAFEVSATTDEVLCNRHGLKDGQVITVASTSALPAPLVVNTEYLVTNVSPNSFQLYGSLNDTTIIDLTTAGTGDLTFKVVGQVVYQQRAVDVNKEGDYTAVWRITNTDGTVDEYFIDGQKNNLTIFK